MSKVYLVVKEYMPWGCSAYDAEFQILGYTTDLEKAKELLDGESHEIIEDYGDDVTYNKDAELPSIDVEGECVGSLSISITCPKEIQ